jgi:hypothetical protein
MPNIIFSVMQKPFIKCVIRQRLVGFYIAEKNLLGVFKKNGSISFPYFSQNFVEWF